MKIKNKNSLELFWYNQIINKKGFIFFILTFFSWIYYIFQKIRNFLYDINILKHEILPCKLISIGNITLGGTGKTPLVELLGEYFTSLNKKISIISRGYGRNNDERLRIVTNGKDLLFNQYQVGDEPYMLALKLKKVPIIVHKDRIEAINKAISTFKSEIIILDDAFQRRNLSFDLNIIIFDVSRPLDIYSMFPAGILREPLNSLDRADIIILNKTSNNKQKINEYKDFIRKYNNIVPVFNADYCFSSLNRVVDDMPIEMALIKNKNITATAGIGNPEEFKKMLLNYGCDNVNLIRFPDHHKYSKKDVIRLQLFEELSDYVITTHKDAIKIKEYLDKNSNLLYININMKIEKEEKFKRIIQNFL